MQVVVKDLNEKELALIEISYFEYRAMANAIDMYIHDKMRDYSETHVSRIICEYKKSHVQLSAIVKTIIESRNYKGLIKEWSYTTENGLKVILE